MNEKTISEWMAEAEQGDANAMCWVGICYHKGQGVEQDDTEAAKWYIRAVEAGSPTAMLILGKCYMAGIGVPKDRTLGLQWVRQAADCDYQKAKDWLAVNLPKLQAEKFERARMLFTGIGAEKDVKTALRLYEEVAEEDLVAAQEFLALCYRFGDEVPKNADLSAYWYLRAQKNGMKDAKNALSDLEQAGGLSAVYLKMRRAALQADGQAAYELWEMFRDDPEKERMALYFCALGAQAGFPAAQVVYAGYFESGHIVKADGAQSRYWLEKAAKGGDPEARFRYGQFLLSQKKDKEAVRLLCAAADGGHLGAQLQMGKCLEYGIGTARDAAEAARIYRQAAARSSRACYLLGNLYLTGRLQDAEPKTALEWYERGKAMDQSSLCIFGIAQCTRDGIGLQRDVDAANRMFAQTTEALKASAAKDDPIALSCLAELYFYGMGGIALSPRDAEATYLRAAEQGEPVAELGLGDCYTRSNMLKDPQKAAHWYARAAESGMPAAQYCYGLCLRNGTGVEKDVAASRELFFAAAKGGHSEAQYTLGEYYAKGIYETEQDPAQAVEWYGAAARSGHAGARYALGQCVEHGVGMARNMETAIEWYRSAAEAGSTSANCRLGELYYAGEGVPQDDKRAAEYFRVAAKTGHIGASYRLGLCYEGGCGVPKDTVLAYEWYKRAGEFPAALYARGVFLADGIAVKRDSAAALDCFLRAADAGNTDAMFRAGYLMLNKKDVKAATVRRAMEYLLQAAEAGQAEAAYTLASCHADARGGIERSLTDAFYWFSRAAEADHSDAQCRLGVCFEYGYGTEKDAAKAVTYYRFAAEQGHAIASYRLARCYDRAIGVPKDAHQALYYYERSAELGGVTALTVLGLRGDSKKSDARLSVAAGKGNAEAAWELALRTEKRTDEAAKTDRIKYLQIAANGGHVKATYYLALALDAGDGVTPDRVAATSRLREAAERGYAPAQYRYGLCLGMGRGTDRDITTARLWLTRAAQNGIAEANDALAMLTDPEKIQNEA